MDTQKLRDSISSYPLSVLVAIVCLIIGWIIGLFLLPVEVAISSFIIILVWSIIRILYYILIEKYE